MEDLVKAIAAERLLLNALGPDHLNEVTGIKSTGSSDGECSSTST